MSEKATKTMDWLAIYNEFSRNDFEECETEAEARSFLESGSNHNTLYPVAIFCRSTRSLIPIDPMGATDMEKVKKWLKETVEVELDTRPPMTAKPKIGKVMISTAGQVFAFDKRGAQIPELQEPLIIAWAKLAESMGYDLDGARIEILDSRTREVKLVRLERGWSFDIL